MIKSTSAYAIKTPSGSMHIWTGAWVEDELWEVCFPNKNADTLKNLGYRIVKVTVSFNTED